MNAQALAATWPADVLEAVRGMEDRRRRLDCFFLALAEDLRRKGFSIEEGGDRWRALEESVRRLGHEFLFDGQVMSYVVRNENGDVLNA